MRFFAITSIVSCRTRSGKVSALANRRQASSTRRKRQDAGEHQYTWHLHGVLADARTIEIVDRLRVGGLPQREI